MSCCHPAAQSRLLPGPQGSQLQVPDVEVLFFFFKCLLASHLLMFFWPKDVPWPSPDSLGEGGCTGCGYREVTQVTVTSEVSGPS